MAMFNSYVTLPEGNMIGIWLEYDYSYGPSHTIYTYWVAQFMECTESHGNNQLWQ